MPDEFVVQRPSHANPPTLLLPIALAAQHAEQASNLGAVGGGGTGRPPVQSSGPLALPFCGGATFPCQPAIHGIPVQAEEGTERAAAIEFLSAAYPRLRTWVRWLQSSQAGKEKGRFLGHTRLEPVSVFGRLCLHSGLGSGWA